MRNENSAIACSHADNLWVRQIGNTAIIGAQEIDRRLPPAKANNNLVIEIGISQESRPNAVGT